MEDESRILERTWKAKDLEEKVTAALLKCSSEMIRSQVKEKNFHPNVVSDLNLAPFVLMTR